MGLMSIKLNNLNYASVCICLIYNIVCVCVNNAYEVRSWVRHESVEVHTVCT